MRCRIHEFFRVSKTVQTMEEKINSTLQEGQFKFAIQSETHNNGKVSVSLFYEGDGPSKVKAKVFRESSAQALEKAIDAFLQAGAKLKFATQTGMGNTLVAVVYHE